MNYIDPIYDWANEGSPEVAEVYPKPEVVETEEQKRERLWKLVVQYCQG